MAPDSPTALEQGRKAYADMAWSDAFDLLTAVDEKDSLNAGDIELLATTAYMLGRVEPMLELLERAHKVYVESGEIVQAARAAVWLGNNFAAYGKIGPALGWLKRGQQLLEEQEESSEVQGYLLIPVLIRHEMAGEFEEVVALAKQASAIGRQFDDPDLSALADQMEGRALLKLGRVMEGLAVLDGVMVTVIGGDLSPQVTGIVYCSVIEGCYEVQEIRRSRDWTAALSGWCDRQPDLVAFTDQCFAHRAEIRRLEGLWEEALDEARKSLGRNARGLIAAQAFYQEAEVHRLRGEFGLAETSYRHVSESGSDPHPGLALLRLAQGNDDAAAASVRRALTEAGPAFERARLLPAFVEVMLAVGDQEAATLACEEFEAISELTAVALHKASSLKARGSLDLEQGQPGKALPSLRAAHQAYIDLDMPYETARTRCLLGNALRGLNDEDTAALELAGARSQFVDLGAKPDVAKVDRILHGDREQQTHGLTPRELEVLQLLATGETNRGIATGLVVSERTIDRHVSNIFTKLGVSTRTAAAAFAFENGLA